MNIRRSILAVAVTVPFAAHAGFQLDEEVQEAPKPTATSVVPSVPDVREIPAALEVERVGLNPSKNQRTAIDRRLSQSGAVLYHNMAGMAPQFAQGMGRDVPLGLAITQIIQNPEWNVTADPMVNMRRAVTWNGGVPWTDALDALLVSVGYSAEVDAQKKEVKIISRGTPVDVRVWELDPSDGSVKRSLEKWAKLAGWQVVWEANYDFPVSLYARIEGTMEDALHAVSKSIRASEAPLKVTMFEGNRVIRVTPADGGKRR